MATPNPEVLFVFDQSSGLPYAGLATDLTFTTYVDDTGSPVTPPAITKIDDGIFVFTPVFPTGHGLFYIISTGGQAPNYLTRYMRPEDDAGGSISDLLNFMTGTWQIFTSGPDANKLVIYGPDGTTPIAKYALFDRDSNPSSVNYFRRQVSS